MSYMANVLRMEIGDKYEVKMLEGQQGLQFQTKLPNVPDGAEVCICGVKCGVQLLEEHMNVQSPCAMLKWYSRRGAYPFRAAGK